jgi:hypothetical protein
MTATKTRISEITNGSGVAGSVVEERRVVAAQAIVDRLGTRRAAIEKRQREIDEMAAEHRTGSARRAEAIFRGAEWSKADLLETIVSEQRSRAAEYADVDRALKMAEKELARVQEVVSREHCEALRGTHLEHTRRKLAVARQLVELERQELAWLSELESGGNSLSAIVRLRTLLRPDALAFAVEEFEFFYPGEL